MEVLNTALKAVGIFTVCFAAMRFGCSLLDTMRKRKRHKRRNQGDHAAAEEKPEKKPKKFDINKMDIILIIIAVTLFVFTRKMISLFEAHMAVPDTLITCVFGVCGGECGVMGWIKTSNERHRDRKWQLEDEERMEAKL